MRVPKLTQCGKHSTPHVSPTVQTSALPVENPKGIGTFMHKHFAQWSQERDTPVVIFSDFKVNTVTHDKDWFVTFVLDNFGLVCCNYLYRQTQGTDRL